MNTIYAFLFNLKEKKIEIEKGSKANGTGTRHIQT